MSESFSVRCRRLVGGVVEGTPLVDVPSRVCPDHACLGLGGVGAGTQIVLAGAIKFRCKSLRGRSS